MYEMLMTAAQHPLTPWAIIAGGAVVILVEAWKVSHTALMGEMFAEGLDD